MDFGTLVVYKMDAERDLETNWCPNFDSDPSLRNAHDKGVIVTAYFRHRARSLLWFILPANTNRIQLQIKVVKVLIRANVVSNIRLCECDLH